MVWYRLGDWRLFVDRGDWSDLAPAWYSNTTSDEFSTEVKDAAKEGNVYCMQGLACWHARNRRYSKARKWWIRVANTETDMAPNAVLCLWLLADLEWRSRGRSPEALDEVRKWLARGVQLGNAEAMWQYACFLADHRDMDDRTPMVRDLIQRAAKNGHPMAKGVKLPRRFF
jgi:hypothetical protein